MLRMSHLRIRRFLLPSAFFLFHSAFFLAGPPRAWTVRSRRYTGDMPVCIPCWSQNPQCLQALLCVFLTYRFTICILWHKHRFAPGFSRDACIASRPSATAKDGGQTGCCWVRQWSVPKPSTKSTAWRPMTGRSLNSSPSTPKAIRSLGSLNVGTITAAFAM